MRRFQLTRESFIPKHYTAKVASKDGQAVAYLYEQNGAPYAIAFCGKAAKPALHFRFRDEARRSQRVTEFFQSVAMSTKAKAERMAKRKQFRHTLKVGDVLRSSWGYDQTNIDFYQVTALVGEHMVEIRAIAQETETTEFMQGKCVPAVDNFTGKPMRKRVTEGNSVKVRSWGAWAHPVEPIEVAGAKVYPASHWTAYA